MIPSCIQGSYSPWWEMVICIKMIRQSYTYTEAGESKVWFFFFLHLFIREKKSPNYPIPEMGQAKTGRQKKPQKTKKQKNNNNKKPLWLSQLVGNPPTLPHRTWTYMKLGSGAAPQLKPTPSDVGYRHATCSLYRFHLCFYFIFSFQWIYFQRQADRDWGRKRERKREGDSSSHIKCLQLPEN